jgi:Flp pilus assembly protein TadB
MSVGPTLWLIMTVGGAALLGLALAYSVISTRRRRESTVAQRATEAGTREVYREEEERRERIEGGGGHVGPHREGEAITVTEARQAVTGHNVSLVLWTSLVLAVLAAVGMYGYLWL